MQLPADLVSGIQKRFDEIIPITSYSLTMVPLLRCNLTDFTMLPLSPTAVLYEGVSLTPGTTKPHPPRSMITNKGRLATSEQPSGSSVILERCVDLRSRDWKDLETARNRAEKRKSLRVLQRRYDDAFGVASPNILSPGKATKFKARVSQLPSGKKKYDDINTNREVFITQHFPKHPHSCRLGATVQRPIFEDVQYLSYSIDHFEPGDPLHDLAQALPYFENLHRF